MPAILGAALLNIGCNFATEMLKSFGKRTWSKTIETELSKYLEEFVDLETDSGSFYKFLNSTENKVNFKEYIRFNAYKEIHSHEDSVVLTRDLFLDRVSKQALKYVQQDIGKEIPIDSIKKYLDRLLQIIEEKLVDSLSTESISTLYFVKQSLSEMEARIIDSLSYRNVTIAHEVYENSKRDYLKIIKRRSKTTQVYGYDELELYSFYVFPKFSIENSNMNRDMIEENISWSNIFVESNIVSVIGGAGFGKSLFLRNLINKHDELNVFEAESLLPIFCDLKKFKIMSQGKRLFSIEDFLIQSMVDFTGMDEKHINKEFLRYFLESGRCLILFDALDEVDKEYRDELNEKVSSFFEVTNQNNKVCITSRASGFTPKTRITYKVNEIDINSVEEYLNKMSNLKFFKKSDKKEFLKQCEILIYNGFLVSFLQLSLLVNIFKAEKELPENKIDLYEKCIEYISRKRERDQKKSSFKFSVINTILDNDGSFEKLSSLSKPNNNEVCEKEVKYLLLNRYKISYSTENETLNAIDEFLKFCSQRTELYVEGTEEGFYKFYHRSFFEFYYAKYLLKEIPSNNKLLDELLTYDIDSEVFDITTSLLKKYYDDRYIDCTEKVLNRMNKLDLNNRDSRLKFSKYSLMLKPVKEVDFIDRYYKFCFSDNRNLAYINKETEIRDVILAFEHIFPIVLRYKTRTELLESCLKYYIDELIAAHFFLKLRLPDIKVEIKLSYVFAEFLFIFEKMFDINGIIVGCETEYIFNLLNKYCEFRDTDIIQKVKSDINNIILKNIE